LFVGDPPVDHLDFVIQFDGGAFREHRVGGSGIVLWKHTSQRLTLPVLSSLVLMQPTLKQWALPTPFLRLRGTFHIIAFLVSSLRVIIVLLLKP